MKKIFFFLYLCFCCVLFAGAAELPLAGSVDLREKSQGVFYPISVEHPYENMKVGDIDNIFLRGSVFNPKAKLTVNGTPVKLNKNGTFIAYVPVKKGGFALWLKAEAEGKTYEAVRNIYVDGFNRYLYMDASSFDEECTSAQEDIWVKWGETFEFTACTAPGSTVYAALSGTASGSILMQETKPGVYKASYTFSAKDKSKKSDIVFAMKNSKKDLSAIYKTPGKLTVLNGEEPAVHGVLKNNGGSRLRKKPEAPGNLYPFYWTKGALKIDGRQNGFYRIRLNGAHSGWIEEKKVKTYRKPDFADAQIKEVSAHTEEEKSVFSFTLSQPVSIFKEEKQDGLSVTFFYTDKTLPVFDFAFENDPLVEKVSYDYPDGSSMRFIVTFKERAALWGYDDRFEGNDYILALIHAPELQPEKNLPLKGARVFVDPGHSPFRIPPYDNHSAVGAAGTLEYEINTPMAHELKDLLEKAGAEVIMSKKDDEFIGLAARVKRAAKARAHIYVSIHQDSMPADTNPFDGAPRGTTVYYFHPHSAPLAAAVSKNMKSLAPVPSNGIKEGDFHVIRPPQIPAVLVENAFLALPEQEIMLNDPKTRSLFVQGIYKGILEFFENKNTKKNKKSEKSKA